MKNAAGGQEGCYEHPFWSPEPKPMVSFTQATCLWHVFGVG